MSVNNFFLLFSMNLWVVNCWGCSLKVNFFHYGLVFPLSPFTIVLLQFHSFQNCLLRLFLKLSLHVKMSENVNKPKSSHVLFMATQASGKNSWRQGENWKKYKRVIKREDKKVIVKKVSKKWRRSERNVYINFTKIFLLLLQTFGIEVLSVKWKWQ